MVTVGLRFNGTGTCVGGAESNLDVGGRYWYSIKVNLPSGGTKDNALSRFQRWSPQEQTLSIRLVRKETSPTLRKDEMTGRQ